MDPQALAELPECKSLIADSQVVLAGIFKPLGNDETAHRVII